MIHKGLPGAIRIKSESLVEVMLNAHSASFTSNAYLDICYCLILIEHLLHAKHLAVHVTLIVVALITLKSPRHFYTLIGSQKICCYHFS